MGEIHRFKERWTNATNEEPDDGELRGFADADLCQVATCSVQQPIPNQRRKTERATAVAAPSIEISCLLPVLRLLFFCHNEVLRNRTHKRTRLRCRRLVSVEDGFERNISPVQRASVGLVLR